MITPEKAAMVACQSAGRKLGEKATTNVSCVASLTFPCFFLSSSPFVYARLIVAWLPILRPNLVVRRKRCGSASAVDVSPVRLTAVSSLREFVGVLFSCFYARFLRGFYGFWLYGVRLL